jgi:alginate O-acetyltransferase complex protein AlgJ
MRNDKKRISNRGWFWRCCVLLSCLTVAALAGPRERYGYRVLAQVDNPSNTYLLGEGGWLAVESELSEGFEARVGTQTTSEMLAKVSKWLRLKNIPLVVAIVPNKTRLYPYAFFPGGHLEQPQRSSYAKLYQNLQDAGVQAIDLASKMRSAPEWNSGLYYRWDSHWNQTGSMLAAKLIAQYVNQNGWRKKIPTVKFELVPDGKRRKTPTDIPDKNLSLNGFVLDDSAKTRLGILPPANETYQLYKAVASTSGSSLFEAAPATVLIGTSFSAEVNKHAFPDNLEFALQSPVANVSIPGGGIATSAGEYFTSDAFSENPPKLIVWEVPEYIYRTATDKVRHLSQTLGPWILSDCGKNGISSNFKNGVLQFAKPSPRSGAYLHTRITASGVSQIELRFLAADNQRKALMVTRSDDDDPHDLNIALPDGLNVSSLSVVASDGDVSPKLENTKICAMK